MSERKILTIWFLVLCMIGAAYTWGVPWVKVKFFSPKCFAERELRQPLFSPCPSKWSTLKTDCSDRILTLRVVSRRGAMDTTGWIKLPYRGDTCTWVRVYGKTVVRVR